MNFARNVNTVKSLAADVPYLTLSDARWLGVSIVAKPGAAYGSILGYGYQKDSKGDMILDPTTLAPLQSTDREILGKGTWNWTGGLTSSFYYKDFGLSFIVDIKQGASLFSMTNLFDVIRGSSAVTLAGRAEWIQSEEARQSAGMSPEQWAAAGNVRVMYHRVLYKPERIARATPSILKTPRALDPSVTGQIITAMVMVWLPPLFMMPAILKCAKSHLAIIYLQSLFQSGE